MEFSSQVIQSRLDFESKRNKAVSLAFSVPHGTQAGGGIVRNFSD